MDDEINMPLLSSSSTDDETMEEDKMKKNLLSIRKFLMKHKRIIVISLSLLLFIGAFLAIFFISFLNYHCLNLEAHDENVIASLKFYDPRNQTLLDFPDEFNDSFNCSIGTVIGIHGYGDSYDTDWLAFSSTLLFNATENEGWCLFSMDWDDIAKYSYISSAKEVRSLGYWLSKTIEENPKVFDSSSLQIVGHSLGAHIAGFAGKEYFSATGTKISKITGVDPAGPLFQTCGDQHRLSVSDADHVLTVITNSGYLFKNGMVRSLQLGSTNLIVNGGVRQPGCGKFENTCSHNRAPWVWLLNAQFGCVLEEDDGPLVDGSFFGPNNLEILEGNFRLETREKDSLIYCDLYENYFPP